MVRRINQDERRRVLAEATWTVMRRDGFEGASVRGVAAEAGLATGSVRHFFATQAELHRFAMAELLRRVAGRVSDLLADQDREPVDRSVAALLQLLPVTDELRGDYLAHLAFLARSAVDPVLGDLAKETYAALDGLYLRVLTELWGHHPGDAVRRLGVLLDGLLVRMLLTPGPDDVALAEADLRRFVTGDAPVVDTAAGAA